MRFDYIHLKAFGHFTDYLLSFDKSKNFHLAYGLNEAGKSTILSSVTDLLYGFPKTTPYSFKHDNKQLRIEGQLRHVNGDKLRFVRRKGTKNTLLDINDSPLPEQKIQQFMNHLSRQQFTHMFALDHVRIREGGNKLLESGGHAGEGLFSAASGMNRIREVLDQVDKKTDSIFKKGRSGTPLINSLVKKERELIRIIAESQMRVKDWKEIENKYHESEQRLQEILNKSKELEFKQRKLRRQKLILPQVAKHKEYTMKMGELGEVPELPIDSHNQFQENKQTFLRAQKDKVRAEEQLKHLNSELAAIQIHAFILEKGPLIESLYKNVLTYENYLESKPGLEKEKQRWEYQALQIAKNIDRSITLLETIETLRIPAETKHTIIELSKQKPLLDQAFYVAVKEENTLAIEIDELSKEQMSLVEVQDLDNLELILEQVKREVRIEEELKQLVSESQRQEALLEFMIRTLPLWTKNREALLEQKFPMNESIKKYVVLFRDFEDSIARFNKSIEEEQRKMEENIRHIRDLERMEGIPTETELHGMREHRDYGWEMIRSKLSQTEDTEEIAVFTKGRSLEHVFEKAMYKADKASDQMRVQAEKVGEKNKLLGDIENSKRMIEEYLSNQEKVWMEWEACKKEWQNCWAQTGISPLEPEEMLEWINKLQQINESSIRYMEVLSEVQQKKEKLTHLKQTLTEILEKLEVTAKQDTLLDLLNRSVTTIKYLQVMKTKRENNAIQLKQIEKKRVEKEVKKERIQLELRQWNDSWKQNIQGLIAKPDASVAVVIQLLELVEHCLSAYTKMKDTEKELIEVNLSIDQFRNEAEILINDYFKHLQSMPIHMAVSQLHRELIDAQKNKSTAIAMEKQAKQFIDRIQECKEEMERAADKQEELRKLAGCKAEELGQVISNFYENRQYQLKLVEIEEKLLSDGEGMTLVQLFEECVLDLDHISVELKHIEEELQFLDEEKISVSKGHGVIQKEYEEKITGHNMTALLAGQKKESIVSSIEFHADQYYLLKMASMLLKRGIEYYREMNQSPILISAGQIFAKVTLNKYHDVTVDYNEKDEPILVGIREDGERVSIEGMSDGTKDQLYLALRLASIEKYVQENEPIPFIVDDILIHFDDERAKETLKVLLELSKKTQVIFFTHHSRLIELMKDIANEDQFQLEQLMKLVSVK